MAQIQLDLHESPAGLPLSKKVSEAIVRDIHRGRFRPGQLLPSSRALSEAIDVHRNTIIAAYDELIEQGYVETKPGRGTFVSDELPRARQTKRATRQAKRSYRPRLTKQRVDTTLREIGDDTIALVGGLPDMREVPHAQLARAYRAALKNHPNCLDYQSQAGQPRLIEQLRTYLATERGVTAEENELVVTRGSQQAIHLAARALARPGSVIAVERCGYPPAWEGLRMGGAQLVPIRVDKSGLVTDDLERLCAERDVAAVYVTPHHQYPTTVTMSAPRRMRLLNLARKHGFVIIEDDYDHEYHFTQHPVLPIASADPHGVVLHIGTLSKIFAPGLRIGYAVGHESLIAHMINSRNFIDRQGDHGTELAISYLMEDGEFGAHVRRMHRKYEARRLVFLDALSEHLGHVLSFKNPSGGLAVWTKIAPDISPEKWAENAAKKDIIIHEASRFYFDGKSRQYFRLGYARHNEEELVDGIKRLAKLIPRATKKRKAVAS